MAARVPVHRDLFQGLRSHPFHGRAAMKAPSSPHQPLPPLRIISDLCSELIIRQQYRTRIEDSPVTIRVRYTLYTNKRAAWFVIRVGVLDRGLVMWVVSRLS